MERRIFGFVVTALIVSAAQSYGATLYTSQSMNSRLGTIDTATGVGADIGSFDVPEGGFAANAAFDTDGTLYTVLNWLADSPEHVQSQLATVDLDTGAVTTIGSPMNVNLISLEIDPRGTAYSVGFHAPDALPDLGLGLFGDTMLYQIDKTSGKLAAIGDTGIDRVMDMAFRSDGTLLATVANNLYSIDPDTGASTLQTAITGVVEATGVEGAEIMGIMFDENDTLFATSFFGGQPDFVSPLFTIDTNTGVATVVGNPGLMNPHGGDIRVPSPPLQAGDANQDLRFDQFDLIHVLRAAKYLTGQPATWGEGDWTGAPGGQLGEPPAGDGVFDQHDILAAQQVGLYLSGRYAAVKPNASRGDLGDVGMNYIPVPEPSGLVVLGLGMLGVLVRRFRQ